MERGTLLEKEFGNNDQVEGDVPFYLRPELPLKEIKLTSRFLPKFTLPEPDERMDSTHFDVDKFMNQIERKGTLGRPRED